MTVTGTLTLTDTERAALRRVGGTGFMGLVKFHDGRRGARYRGVRTDIFRTAEAAEEAAAKLPRFKQAERFRGAVLIDTTGEYSS